MIFPQILILALYSNDFLLNVQEDHGCISSIEAQSTHDQGISWVVKLSHALHFISQEKEKKILYSVKGF